MLFLGPAPKVCRRGKRLDGSHDRGWALLQVVRNGNVATTVHYPRNLANTNGDRQTEQVGPFTMCAPVAADRGIYACKAEEYTAVEIYRNTSAVWIQDALIVGQSTFFQFMGIVQSIVFAMLAGASKLRPLMFRTKRTPLFLKAAADAATGGVVTMALLFARGRSIVGLDLELGTPAPRSAKLQLLHGVHRWLSTRGCKGGQPLYLSSTLCTQLLASSAKFLF